MQTQFSVNEEKIAENIGKVLTVLVDGYDEVAEVYYARSYADAPDVDGKVFFKSETPISAGSFVDVEITEALDYDLIGEIVE